MQLFFVFLCLLAITCQGKSVLKTNDSKGDSKQMDEAKENDAGCMENACQGNAANVTIKPRSCVDHLKNGARKCGFYEIYDAAGGGFTVYCDMETEPGAAWTLIMSWSLKNKHFPEFSKTPLSIDGPVNENSPNWELYRLTLIRMNSLKDVSSHWRATCSFDKYGINDYKDYVRGKFAEADILSFIGEGVCLKTEHVNIRGHVGIHKTAKFWQVVNTFGTHIDSSDTWGKGCQFNPTVGSVATEDNFGFYGATNPKFTCTMNEDSTTQWWFGGYE